MGLTVYDSIILTPEMTLKRREKRREGGALLDTEDRLGRRSESSPRCDVWRPRRTGRTLVCTQYTTPKGQHRDGRDFRDTVSSAD